MITTKITSGRFLIRKSELQTLKLTLHWANHPTVKANLVSVLYDLLSRGKTVIVDGVYQVLSKIIALNIIVTVHFENNDDSRKISSPSGFASFTVCTSILQSVRPASIYFTCKILGLNISYYFVISRHGVEKMLYMWALGFGR